MPPRHKERHPIKSIGWSRAAVLGANDGIVSTSSLVLGVAAAHATHGSILIAGVAGLVAGAMSMAAGEYVSVSSQSDTEKADIARERRELSEDPQAEHDELVPHHSDDDWLILSQFRMGRSFGATRTWMLRATPG